MVLPFSMEIVAEPVVSFVVERIGDWLIEEAKLLTGVRSQVKAIQAELGRMECFLTDADAKYKTGATERNFVIEIQDIAYDSEDVIETFVLKVASRRERERRGGKIRYFLLRYVCIFNKSIDRHNVGSEIKAIRIKISQLSTSLQTYGIRSTVEGDQGSSSSAYERLRLLRRSYSHVIEEDFTGLENDVKNLVEHLLNEDKDGDNWHQTVSICGMGGLGKTTLAQKVYNHSDVKRHFDGLAWVCISQQLQKQDVLKGILIKLIPEKEKEIRRMMDEELVRMLFDVQKMKKCLIVVDDIWTVEAWDILKCAFPIGKTSNSRSKILLTTRNKEVAKCVNPVGLFHEPRFLTDGEAWELLQTKAFRRANASSDIRCDKRTEELGWKMVRHCGGLPLAVVVLGGILVTKDTVREWEKVHGNINLYMSRGIGSGVGQHYKGVSQVLALSYDDLPYQLKRCFLYLGSFPEDSQIELEKVYELWMAEDLVLLDDVGGEDTKMDVAERYLSELSQRYIVQLGVEESISERFEYCRLHDRMQEVCESRNKEEKFLNVIDFGKRKGTLKPLALDSLSSSNAKVRRLAIHLGKDDFEENELVSNFEGVITCQGHLRSLLLFGDRDSRLIKEYSHWKYLKVLRVVHLQGVKLNKLIPKVVIEKLIHLRYLNLRNCQLSGKLPSSIGNLRCLQTLDLRGNYTLIIPNVLWKIKSLTHLYLHKRNGKKMRLDGLSKLEILEHFNSGWCDVNELFKLTNLRKLRASLGDYAKKADKDVVGTFVNYLSNHSRLRHSSIEIYFNFKSEEEKELIVLRKLMECRHLNRLELIGIIGDGNLPAANHISPSLTTLVLTNSKLKEEDPMATLEKLPNLRHLMLNDAFEGAEIVCSEEGFPQLKSLQLYTLSNLEQWRVDKGAMPNLSHLVIDGCGRLKMVPDGLRFVNTLQKLEIWLMPKAFVRRLKVVDGEEGADHYKIQHIPDIQFYLIE